MPSETDVVNHALRLLKAGRITNLLDGSKNANVANDIYTEVRDAMLRSHTWKFGERLAKLAQLTTVPAFAYDHAYALPANWIRTISVHSNDAGTGTVDYQEAEVDNSGVLLASVDELYLRYVYRVTDPNRMAPDFRTALAYELAMSMPGISNMSASEWETTRDDAKRALRIAKSADSLGSPPLQRPRGSWANSRNSWPSDRWPR